MLLRTALLFLGVTLSLCLNQFHENLYLNAIEDRFSHHPASWQTFQQQVDHFDNTNPTTFSQRWCSFVADGFKNGKPIFVYVGGEARMRDTTCSTGMQVELAKEFDGMTVALEHRFYGESYPTEDLSVKSLRFLSSRQALYDLAEFTAFWKNKFPTSPAIIVGGSYPAVLAAISRQMFPHLYAGAWASSGPLLAKQDFFEYDQQVRDSLDSKCANNVRQATVLIEKILKDPAEKLRLKKMFRAENITDDREFLYILADATSFGVQYNYIKEMCLRMDNVDLVKGYADYVTWLFDFLQTDANAFSFSKWVDEKKDVHGSMRQWIWQSCTEFGYWQVADPKNPLRSTRIDLDFHLYICKFLYNTKFSSDNGVNSTNHMYGGLNFGGSNVAFSNGDLDPWKHLSLRKVNEKQYERNNRAVVIKNVAHCADLHQPSSSDPQSLVEGRKYMVQQVRSWINDYYSRVHFPN